MEKDFLNIYMDFNPNEDIPLKSYWDWKGGGAPIFLDSLVCTDSELFRLVRLHFSDFNNVEIFLNERVNIYVIRVDTIDNNIVFNFREDGAFWNYKISLYEHLTGKGKFNPNSASDLQGFCRVDGKIILVYGNYVDPFFERFPNVEMGSPLGKRKDNSYSSIGGMAINESQWFYIYEDGVANEYYISRDFFKDISPEDEDLYEKDLPCRISHYFYDPKIYRESMQEALKNKQLHFR